uniref:UDP-glycosyltransferases domain-containing protein n=1 Tax=Oryza nivara TaxID=4536 RepID=A0A0E0IE37_ORYNI
MQQRQEWWRDNRGFLERTSGQGAVVKQWAPQVDVLHHRVTDAFVTHCGCEGITAGVPMLCWPLHSEQKMNKVLMVEEMGIAVELVGWQQGLVTAAEVEAKVRLVMESEAAQPAQGAGHGAQGRRGHGLGRWRLVAFGICPNTGKLKVLVGIGMGKD